MSAKFKNLTKQLVIFGAFGVTFVTSLHAATVDLLVTYDEPINDGAF